jgi:hypothetical protein
MGASPSNPGRTIYVDRGMTYHPSFAHGRWSKTSRSRNRMTTRLRQSGSSSVPARWISSARTGIGTMLGYECILWFTINHDIVNEEIHHGV